MSAMLRVPDARHQRIGAESRKHMLVSVDESFHVGTQARGNRAGGRNQQAGAERLGKRGGVGHALRERNGSIHTPDASAFVR